MFERTTVNKIIKNHSSYVIKVVQQWGKLICKQSLMMHALIFLTDESYRDLYSANQWKSCNCTFLRYLVTKSQTLFATT